MNDGSPQSALLTLFIQIVAPVLFTGLAGILAWALNKLAKYLDAKAETNKLAAVELRLTLLAATVVADLDATLKPKLLLATADGVLTKAEVDELRAVALERLKHMAGEKGLEEAKAILGIAAPKLSEFLLGLIELAVARQPSPPPPGPTPTPVPSP